MGNGFYFLTEDTATFVFRSKIFPGPISRRFVIKLCVKEWWCRGSGESFAKGPPAPGGGLAAAQAQGPFSVAPATLPHAALSTFPTAGPQGWAGIQLPYAHCFLGFSENKITSKIKEQQGVGRSAGRVCGAGAQGGFLQTWKRVWWGLLVAPLGARAPSEEPEGGGTGRSHLCRDTSCGLAVATCEQACAPQEPRLNMPVAQPKESSEGPGAAPAASRHSPVTAVSPDGGGLGRRLFP